MRIYLIIFIILILLSMINIYIDKQKLIIMYILFSIFLIIFTGFRDSLGGSDYSVYKAYFDNIPSITSINSFEYFIEYEIGYKYLNAMIKFFTDNSMWLFFVITIITLPVTLIFNYKYCKYPFFTLTFYLYKTFFYTNFIAMRQSIAIVIFYISIRYIIKGDLKKYSLCIIFASLFHSSSIVLILLYFVRNLKMEKINIIYILIIGVTLMLVSPSIINLISKVMTIVGASSTVINKINNISFSKSINLHLVEIIGFYFIFAKDFKIESDFDKIVYNLFITYVILLIIFSNQAIFIRISMYFYMIIMIFISLSLSKTTDLKYKRLLTYTLMLVFFVGYIKYLRQFDNGGLVPYKTILLSMTNIY